MTVARTLPEHKAPPPVSIIIPAHNAAPTLPGTIQSLAADAEFIREIILIDDDSSDATAEVGHAAARRLGVRLTLRREKRRNAGACRNVGLGLAKGEFVYFLDADDEVIAGGIGYLREALRRNPGAGMAIGGYVRRAKAQPDRLRRPSRFDADPRLNARNYLMNRKRSIAVGSALVRRGMLADCRFPESAPYGEDTLFWTAVLTRTRVTSVEQAVMVYNFDDQRNATRMIASARRNYLEFSLALDGLYHYGLDQAALKWCRAWQARRIARALIRAGQPVAARSFMRVPLAHPQLRHTFATTRYCMRLRRAESAMRAVL